MEAGALQLRFGEMRDAILAGKAGNGLLAAGSTLCANEQGYG